MANALPEKKLLITGVSGLLGNNLAYYFRDKYEVLGLYNSNSVTIRGIRTEQCDMCNPDSIQNSIHGFDPSIIIHCASLANVDECEKDKSHARDINVLATRSLVECIADKDIKLIYISTDSVYDGVKGDFSETDTVNPLNYYGRSKYEGELEVGKKENSLVFRTNIFGWNIQDKESIGEWILNKLESNQQINGFSDAFFSSIYTLEFARAIDIAIRKDISGIYNCGTTDSCSKYEFAKKFADCFGFDRNLVSPISVDDFSFTARRGKTLNLNVTRLQEKINYKLPTIDQSIESFYRDFKCGLPETLKQKQYSITESPGFISYGRQRIDEHDIQAVIDVLHSDRITQGPKIAEFEKALAAYCGARYAVAVNSGTSALHIACLAAGMKQGDEVITSPNTFVASSNCAVYCSAHPVFGDISPETYNILPSEIEKKITGQTRAVIPVHFAGQSCAMDAIHTIVRNKEKKFNTRIFIIEDGCHALGSSYRDKKVGSCFYSDMTVMSFHPVKHITTGEGGVVLTNDEALYKRLIRFRSHGITSTPGDFIYPDNAYPPSALTDRSAVNPWYYEQVDLGYNYRITDIQCALGLSQFTKLPFFQKRRREIVNRYNRAFQDNDCIHPPLESRECDSNFHLYVLLIDFDSIGIERARFMSELQRQGIQTQVHYIPVHTQPYYRINFGTDWGHCPNAEAYYQKCLSIPLYPSMTDADADKVIREILRIVKQ